MTSINITTVKMLIAYYMCPILCNPMDCSQSDSSVHGDSPDRKTGMGCHTLLQGTFLTQEIKPRFPAL